MKISVQTGDVVDEMGLEEGYRLIRDAGFEAVDWNIDHAWKYSEVEKAKELKHLSIFEEPMEKILDYYATELAEMKKNGIEITQAHAPFKPYSAHREDILDYAISIYDKMIRFCSVVGCPRLVIHGISLQPDEPDMTAEDIRRLNDKLYTSLIPALLEVGNVRVCLENLFSSSSPWAPGFWEGVCSDPHEAVDMIDTYNEKAGKEVFGLCLDFGHLMVLRKNPRLYIPLLGKRIIALHIHDNISTSDSHLMPYACSAFPSLIVDELRKIGYSGDLSFETFVQTRSNRLPKALLPAFLRTIFSTGEYFRSVIEG